ncbi:hypothetical protein AB6A40_007799 [Gnathostoma spinigerum]|uniref:Transmembrane protein n=1 Tax=Gnathostoma spinigerum TaxID=75299 RepID=A0ABD6EXW8_9BILA
MNSAIHNSARLRSKQPVYTSDKRAKFTQRENKKWIRFATVIGYIFFVSLPAISLSFYYVYMWDPDYVNKELTGLDFEEKLPIPIHIFMKLFESKI